MSSHEHDLPLGGVLKRLHERKISRQHSEVPRKSTALQKAEDDFQRALGGSPNIDDKFTILQLTRELEQTRSNTQDISRRHFLRGLAAVGAITAMEAGAFYYVDTDSHSTNPLSETDEFSYINTLNPDHQIPTNSVNATDYLWRVALPYQQPDQPIEISTESAGLEYNQNLLVNPTQIDIHEPVFTGPDQKLYRYVYSIPTREDDKTLVHINTGTSPDMDNIKSFVIDLNSYIPEIGDRTGTFIFEEPGNDNHEVLLSQVSDINSESEKLLPDRQMIVTWVPSLEFPGQIVITDSRHGIVIDRETLNQPNALQSEVPYLHGRLIYRAGISSSEMSDDELLIAYANFNRIATEYTKLPYVEGMGGRIERGEVTLYPPYLQQLQVTSYDNEFSKAGHEDTLREFTKPDDIFAQMYTIASSGDYFNQFIAMQANPSLNTMQRSFARGFWKEFFNLATQLQSSPSRPEAIIRVKNFLEGTFQASPSPNQLTPHQ